MKNKREQEGLGGNEDTPKANRMGGGTAVWGGAGGGARSREARGPQPRPARPLPARPFAGSLLSASARQRRVGPRSGRVPSPRLPLRPPPPLPLRVTRPTGRHRGSQQSSARTKRGALERCVSASPASGPGAGSLEGLSGPPVSTHPTALKGMEGLGSGFPAGYGRPQM